MLLLSRRRNKVETDIDEVLHTETVFSNLQKGVIAKSKDLKKAFGTEQHQKAALIILDKGELQVSDKERQLAYDNMFRDIVTIITDKCVNPESGRPYPFSMIETALRDIHFSVVVSKSAKKQALEAIRKLESHMAIKRAQMRLRLVLEESCVDSVKSKGAVIEKRSAEGSRAVLTVLIDPGIYRDIDSIIVGCGGSLEVVDMAVLEAGSADIDAESERKAARAAAGDKDGSAGAGGAGDAEAKGGEVTTRPAAASGRATKGKVVSGGSKLTCNSCGANFEDRGAHREHFKSDWHRINQKRKMKGMPPVDEAEYEALGDAVLDDSNMLDGF